MVLALTRKKKAESNFQGSSRETTVMNGQSWDLEEHVITDLIPL